MIIMSINTGDNNTITKKETNKSSALLKNDLYMFNSNQFQNNNSSFKISKKNQAEKSYPVNKLPTVFANGKCYTNPGSKCVYLILSNTFNEWGMTVALIV